MVRHHFSELPLHQQFYRLTAEPRRQRAVERRRRSAALQVTEDDVARLLPGQFFELRGAANANTAKAFRVAAVRGLDQRDAAVLWMGAFGDDHNAKACAELVAIADTRRDAFEVVRNFGNENHVRATGDAAVQCDPPGV